MVGGLGQAQLRELGLHLQDQARIQFISPASSRHLPDSRRGPSGQCQQLQGESDPPHLTSGQATPTEQCQLAVEAGVPSESPTWVPAGPPPGPGFPPFVCQCLSSAPLTEKEL